MRHLSQDIYSDEIIGPSGDLNRQLWIGLIVCMADDQGRMIDNPAIIRSTIFPYDEKKTIAMIEAGLKYFEDRHKITRYIAGSNGTGRKLIQINNWWKHQRSTQWAAASQYPAPDKWVDRIRTNVHGFINWDHAGGFDYSKARQRSGKEADKKPLRSGNEEPKKVLALTKEKELKEKVKTLLSLSGKIGFLEAKHPGWINDAIAIANGNGKDSPKYIVGILNNWITEGRKENAKPTNSHTKRTNKPKRKQADAPAYSDSDREVARRIVAAKAERSKANV